MLGEINFSALNQILTLKKQYEKKFAKQEINILFFFCNPNNFFLKRFFMLSLRENRERHENVCFGFYRPEENDDLWGDEGTDREVMSAFIEDTFDFGR